MTPTTRARFAAAGLACASFLLLPAFKKAALRVPEALAAVTPIEVTGHQVRTLNKPMGLGPFRAESVKEGVEFSWSIELFRVRGGSARRRYRFVLQGPDGVTREVECRSRAIEAWRDGWSVQLTDLFTPRLACGVRSKERLLRLVLGSRTGHGLRGVLVASTSETPLLEVRSLHKLEGTPLALDEPAGYALALAGVDVGAVETLNRGRLWLSEELDADGRADVAAVAAALLLYKPELTPQVDTPGA